MQLNEAVSKRLIFILEERNLTQYQLFKLSGIPRSTIGNIINCSYNSVKLRVIHEICMGLGISITEFFTSSIFEIENLDD
ncbi:MAG: helix-turn-helix transcriptional regulator [bacterium]